MKLSGVIPANILPLTEELDIDEPAYRAHLTSLANTPGVTAITCNGHAAEVASLDRHDRRRAVALAAESVAGKLPLIAGIHAENSRQAASLAQDAQAEGASALLVFPPPILALGGRPEMAYKHVSDLASAVPLPIILFSFPAFTGMAYELDTIQKLCMIENVVAIKEWTLDLAKHEETRRIIQDLPKRVSLLTSFSTNLLPALCSGADGILSGHGSVVAPLHVQLWNEVTEGSLYKAKLTYDRLKYLTAVIYRYPLANMYARMKEHLIMLGADMTRAVRPPLEGVTPEERQELRDALTHSQYRVAELTRA